MNNYRRGAYSDSRRDGQAGETGPLPSLAYLADWPATRRCRPTSPAARKMSLFTAREKQSIYDNLRPWFEPADRRCPASRAARFVFLRSLKLFSSSSLSTDLFNVSNCATIGCEDGRRRASLPDPLLECRSPVVSYRRLVAPFCGSVNGRVN